MKRKFTALVPVVPSAATALTVPAGYDRVLAGIKQRIRVAQVRAGLAANRELVLLYWDIGRIILDRQNREGWGAKVILRLSLDLSHAFPALHGFSPRNLLFMRAFAEAYPAAPKVKQLVSQIPWGHIIRLLQAVKSPAEREWYIRQTVVHGWSRNILEMQIETGLVHRQGQAVTNFSRTLPASQSDLAQQILKDPYVFDFLTLADDARERELENALLDHLRDFLLELGAGFAFVGRQVRLEVSGEDFSIDLLFYHLKLRCYVVIDLKTRAFLPEDAGKMNFYLSAADDLLRHPQDQPSIGLLLCREKPGRRLVLEYALRDMRKPIGVSHYQLTRALPDNLKSSLPSIEEIEAELARDLTPAAGRKSNTRVPRHEKRKTRGNK
ncbi:MAG: PDDEXK nuclease domain-containing protein [Verrucomicrobia bacterium]|nr:PDDEXK nuclease domain-containing protein [Verrucomicrobiota bacterium]